MPLHAACDIVQFQIVEYLINQGCDSNPQT